MAVFALRDDKGKVKTWVAMVNFTDHEGKRRQKRYNAPTAVKAKELESDLLQQRKRKEIPGQTKPSDAVPAALTVAAYLEKWVKDRERDINQSTATRYRELLAHVTREAGTLALDKLTAPRIKAIYGSLIDSGRSPKTALNLHRVLRKALQDAIDSDELITVNPAKKQIAPRAEKFEPYVLERDELDRIFTFADETPIGPLARLAAWTGLRLGEALALSWDSIRLDSADLTVRRTLGTSGRLGKPKTRRSARTIDLSPATVAMLRDVKRQQDEDKLKAGPAYVDAGFVFADALGGPRSQSSVDHIWRTVALKAGVPRARFHDLRHAHASHLLAGGFEVASVAERLGHSQTSTTLNIYSHALRPRNAAMVQAIDRILGGDSPE